jgi:hypothetical protein
VTARITDGNALLVSPSEYEDVQIEAAVSTPNREASLAVRVRDEGNFYLAIFLPDGVPTLQGRSGGVWLYKSTDGVGTFLMTGRPTAFAQAGDTIRLRLVARASTLTLFMNGREVIRAVDETHRTGRVGLRIFGDKDGPCDATFASVRVTTP